MEIRYPAYYESFRCLASNCPDSCCKDWAVQVDEASARLYRSLPGALGNALKASLKCEDGDLILALTEDGRCPMWRKDGLCQIQAQLGADSLCQVCRTFPRLRHDYGDFVELGLELSCPEAARLILNDRGESLIVKTVSGGSVPDYDKDAMVCLLNGREQALSILHNRQFSPGQALAVLLFHGYHVQAVLNGAAPSRFDPANALAKAQNYKGAGNVQSLIALFYNLEILTQAWRQRLDSPVADAPWSESLRAMACYGVERYYLQAVADYDLVSRIKLIILSCLIVKVLGGDLIRTAQLYSKEIENDADNIDALLDLTYTSPALSDRHLLALLLSE